MNTVTDCPHCAFTDPIPVSVRFNNGSAQNRFYRCPECDTEWFTDRQNRIAEVTVTGATKREKRSAINQFAALQWETVFLSSPIPPFPNEYPFILSE